MAGIQQTKAQIQAAWVDGATVGPDDAASTDNLWESLVFRSGENSFTEDQAFEKTIIGEEQASKPPLPYANARKLYAKSDGWYDLDDAGNEKRLAYISDVATGTTDEDLLAWTEGEAYQATSIIYDSDGVLSSASVTWPDGSSGTLTVTAKNSTWLAVDAYQITHNDSGKTITQSAVTRDSNGAVTSKPALTIS